MMRLQTRLLLVMALVATVFTQLSRADDEGVQQRDDLGPLVPIGRRRARGQWHARPVREAVKDFQIKDADGHQ
jgi:hypothetical protein